MNDEITVHGGILGTRILAAAFANVALRKRGLLIDGKPATSATKYIAYGDRRYRAWRPDEIKLASDMRRKGKTLIAIGAILKRTKGSVSKKLECDRS